MPDVTITLSNINDSLSVGDVLYYTSSSNLVGFNTTVDPTSIIKIGTCKTIGENFIVVDHSSVVNMPSAGDFLFFSKDNSVNLSSIIGYYAEAKFVNDSIVQAELFSVNAGIEQSSK